MANIYDMIDTWNDGATTFTAIKMDVTDTASAAGSLLMDLQVGGSSKFSVSKGAGAFFDIDIFEQRNGTNPQTLNIYNTYTDASNYERGFMRWNSNVLEIGTEAAGTGGNRNARLSASGSNVVIATSGADRVTINSGGFDPGVANAYSLGNTFRPFKQAYLGQFQEFADTTTPTTPAANKLRIYAKDNGAGKTQLVVLMPDGVETVLATET